MPFFYDNDGTINEGDVEYEKTGVPFYSETQRTWTESQDWTREGVEILTLWFHGDPGNPVEPFYVALEDSAGNRKDIEHPDPAAVTIDDWKQWRIPLTDFTDVDPTAIRIMSIGVGDRASSQPGGSGVLYVDDIELVPLSCCGDKDHPYQVGDLNQDCRVDLADLALFCDCWLQDSNP